MGSAGSAGNAAASSASSSSSAAGPTEGHRQRSNAVALQVTAEDLAQLSAARHEARRAHKTERARIKDSLKEFTSQVVQLEKERKVFQENSV